MTLNNRQPKSGKTAFANARIGMFFCACLAALTVLFYLLPVAALAQSASPNSSSNTDATIKEAERAYNEKDYKNAQFLYQSAFDSMPDQTTVQAADVLRRVGQSAVYLGNYTDAEQILKRTLSIIEKSQPYSADMLWAYDRLGFLYMKWGKYERAEKEYAQAESLGKKMFPQQEDKYGQLLLDMAVVKAKQKHFQEAIDKFEPSIKLCRIHGEDPWWIGGYLRILAQSYEGVGDYDHLEQTLGHAISNYDKGHYILASDLADLGRMYAVVLTQKGKADDAAQMAKWIDKVNACPPVVADPHILFASMPGYAPLLALGGNGKSIANPSGNANKRTTDASGNTNGKPSGQSATAPAPSKQPSAGNAQTAKIANTVNAKNTAADRPVHDKWALVCGISKFQDPTIPQLNYPAKDATDFFHFLINDANFAPDHVRLLLNEKATQRRILTELGDKFLPRVVKPDDLVVIFISSHGSPSQVDVRNKNYLVAYDTEKTNLFASGIEMQDLAQLIKDRVRSERVLIILDACHSGAADAEAKGAEPDSNFDAEKIAQGSGQLVICSSAPTERSWESKRYPNGVFTRKLIEGFKQKGIRTPLQSAFDYAKNAVEDEVQQDQGVFQTPVLRSQWTGSDILLSAPANAPNPLPPAVRQLLPPDSSSVTATLSNPDKEQTANKSKVSPGAQRKQK